MIRKLWPARQKHDADLVADLDALINDPVKFKLHGKTCEIKPLNTEEFFRFSNAYAKLMNAYDNNTPAKDLVHAYTDLFSGICTNVTEKDVENMTTAQVGALFQLIIETVTGRVNVDQKKTMEKMRSAAQLMSQGSTVQN